MLLFQLKSAQAKQVGSIADMPPELAKHSRDPNYKFLKVTYTSAKGEAGHWRLLVQDVKTKRLFDYKILGMADFGNKAKWRTKESYESRALAGCSSFSYSEFNQSQLPEQTAGKHGFVPQEKPAEKVKNKPASKLSYVPRKIGRVPDPLLVLSAAGKYRDFEDLPNGFEVKLIIDALSEKTKSGRSLFSAISDYSRRYGIDLPTAIALFYLESSLDPSSINNPRKGEYYYGLGQIKPSTAFLVNKLGKPIFSFKSYNGVGELPPKAGKWGILVPSHDANELLDAEKNSHACMRYLAHLKTIHKQKNYALSVYGGDTSSYSKKQGHSNYSRMVSSLAGYFRDIGFGALGAIPKEDMIATANAIFEAIAEQKGKGK